MRGAIYRHGLKPVIAADAMVLMHHKVTRRDLGRVGDELVRALMAFGRAGDALAEHILLRHQRHPVGEKTALDPQHRERHTSLWQRPGLVSVRHGPHVTNAVLAQHERQAFARTETPGRQHHGAARCRPFGAQVAKPVGEHRRHRLARQSSRGRPRKSTPVAPSGLPNGENSKHGRRAQQRIEALTVEIQHPRRDWPVWLFAGPGRAAPLRSVMVRDQLQPCFHRALGLMVQTHRRAPGT